MASQQSYHDEPLAIIGLSCRFGGEADSTENFLKVLHEARSVYGPIPSDRFDANFYYHPDQNHIGTAFSKGGYYLADHPAKFDSAFFSLPSQDVLAMDPQQKLLLENSYHALENAGLKLPDIRGSNTSVFVGSSANDHIALAHGDLLLAMKHKSTGTAFSLLSNRISWLYDLRGTSQTIDTACSSSMVAFHLACSDIRLGHSNMAIVSGINIVEHPASVVSLSGIGVLSPDGQCFSYDEKGNGYGRGEGVGTVIIKPLGDALRDGNRIRAVVRATGSNQDGKTTGITLPNHLAQQKLIEDCYASANIDPNVTSYIEAHGTGTPVGDPLEMKGITSALAAADRKTPLYVGSVNRKWNNPPVAHFENLNKDIPRRPDLIIAKKPTPWPRDDIRRASINSFGYGGTNAHAIIDDIGSFLRTHPEYLQEALPKSEASNLPAGLNSVYAISGYDEQGIQRNADKLLTHLKSVSFDKPEEETLFLSRLQNTLNNRRQAFNWRSFVVAPNLDGLRQSLEAKLTTSKIWNNPHKFRFVFTGQGAGWTGMGRDLLVYPIFRQRMDEASVYLQGLGAQWHMTDVISLKAELDDYNEPTYAQTASVTVQVALVDLIRSWGLTPSSVVGHSSGEIPAAYCAGKISRQAAWKIAYSKGLAVRKVLGKEGGMMAAAMSEDAANAVLSKVKLSKEDSVMVGCINSPKSVTFTGNKADIAVLKAALDEEDIMAKVLPVKVAYHSTDMNEAGPVYHSLLGSLEGGDKLESAEEIIMVSSVTGLPVTTEQVLNPAYWVENLVSPVRFSQALSYSLTMGASDAKVDKAGILTATETETIIEIGPHSALKAPITETLAEVTSNKTYQYRSFLRRGESSRATLLDTVGLLHTQGFQLDLDLINETVQTFKAPLEIPAYAFDHSASHRATSRTIEALKFPAYGRHELLGVPVSDANSFEQRWRNIIRVNEIPWLATNIMNGKVMFPGVGYILMAAEAALQRSKDATDIIGIKYRNISFRASLLVPDPEGVEMILSLQPESVNSDDWLVFRIISYDEAESTWVEHCVGHVSLEKQRESGASERQLDVNALQKIREEKKFSNKLTVEGVYKDFESAGMTFGDILRNIHSVDLSEDTNSCVSTTKVPEIPKTAHDHYILHPCVLESMFHTLLTICGPDKRYKNPSLVATGIKECWISTQVDSYQDAVHDCFATTERQSATVWRSSLVAHSANTKEPQVLIQGVDLIALPTSSDNATEKGKFYDLKWEPDVKLLSSIDTLTILPAKTGAPKDLSLEEYRDFQLVASVFVLDTLDYLRTTELSAQPVQIQTFISWMEKQQQLISADKVQLVSKSEVDRIRSSPELKQGLVDKVSARSRRGELLTRIGARVASILEQKEDTLQLMFSTEGFMHKVHDENLPTSVTSRVATYFKYLWHNLPEIKVLEIGAGSGSATGVFFETLTQILEDEQFPRETLTSGVTYHFTDLSSASFEDAEKRFRKWSDVLQFKTLDIERDPAEQGIELESYDLIIASNVLHATKDIAASLKNVKSLLKQGGDLFILENARPDFIFSSVALGALPSWWRGTEDFRRESPLLDDSEWQNQLKLAGFEPRIHIKDSEYDGAHEISAFVANTRTPSGAGTAYDGTIVYFEQSDASTNVAKSLQKQFQEKSQWTASLVDFKQLTAEIVKASGAVILVGLQALDLSRVTPQEFDIIQQLLNTAEKTLWVTGDPRELPKDAMVHGMLRSVRWEQHDDSTNIVSFGLGDSFTETEYLAGEILRVAREAFEQGGLIPRNAELMLKDGALLAGRLQPSNSVNTLLNSTDEYFVQNLPLGSVQEPLKLTSYESTPINRFGFVASEKSVELAAHEIRIEVQAIHLTHQELIGMNELVPGTEVGKDGVGIVRAVGSAVKHIRAGDSVMFISNSSQNGTFGTYFTGDERSVLKVPSSMSANQAALLPFALSTAYHALVNIANLKSRHTVVIPVALREVGKAAIQLAKELGSTIIALAANEKERQIALSQYSIAPEHVVSLDEGSVTEKVLALTSGKGADVFFNQGQSSDADIPWISNFGHIVSLQQKARTQGARTAPAARGNVTYSSINMDEYRDQRPDDFLEVFAEVAQFVSQYKLDTAQSVTTMPFSGIKTAIEKAFQGEDFQQTVFTPRQNDLVPICKKPLGELTYSENATYLLLGGFGGIGRSIARWMFARGARNFIILSRSGLRSAPAKELYDELTAAGANIDASPCDINNREALKQVLDDCARRMPPIKGAIQCSMVLRDAMFANMTHEQFTEAIDAKVQGSENAAALVPKDIDFFVMLSSSSAMIGNRGQTNYSAANAFMDSYARTLVKQGIPATSISLGSVEAVGWLAENATPIALSHDSLTEERVLNILEYHMDPRWAPGQSLQTCHTICGLRSVHNFLHSSLPLPDFMSYPLFSTFMKSASSSESAATNGGGAELSLESSLKAATALNQAIGLVMKAVLGKISKEMLISQDELEPTRSMISYGIDSLVAVDLRSWFKKTVGVSLTIDDILGDQSMAELADKAASTSTFVPSF
ncbi:Highly reducing polyketide synthase otaA [Cladobotryum mycophilum]|uniref:Highly reducing polyketide synthase otaA n=1 Tax=Cladobotryum mycophilum TaxID=491253 RepID=A0ABR0SW87_9HYPO